MESSCVRCRSLEDTSNVGGMIGMDDDIQSQTTGVHYVSNTRQQRAGQDGDDRARGALDVQQQVVLRNEGFAGHVWPEQQASGAILEMAGMFNNPQMIYQFYPHQYYTM